MPANNTAVSRTGAARIPYKEIFSGDVRKTKAESNDSDAGGGARDFHFGEFEKLESRRRLGRPDVTAEIRNSIRRMEPSHPS
jgi:hypothetical protein